MIPEFKYWKEQHFKEGCVYYFWYIADQERNGVHFHGVKSEKPDQFGFANRHNFQTHGIEIHSKTPRYEEQKPIPDCHVTKGDCYCDGTSLYAEERLGHVNPDNCDDEVWHVLESFYRTHFGGEP